jgi:hypothetical protein
MRNRQARNRHYRRCVLKTLTDCAELHRQKENAVERHSLHLGGEARSRRAALGLGGALLAMAGALMLPASHAASAQGTPTAGGDGTKFLALQAFSKGSLFPTQGDAVSPSFTLILWDAADRGVFYASSSPDGGAAGIAPTESLIIAIEAGERPLAAAVLPASSEASEPQVFALRLAYAGLGSDPDAITFQGEPVPVDEVGAWLGVTPAPTPEGASDLASGYLLIVGLPGLDLPETGGIRISAGA